MIIPWNNIPTWWSLFEAGGLFSPFPLPCLLMRGALSAFMRHEPTDGSPFLSRVTKPDDQRNEMMLDGAISKLHFVCSDRAMPVGLSAIDPPPSPSPSTMLVGQSASASPWPALRAPGVLCGA